jgi:desulfoferrodoxin (superoxide reductase-like protein)
MGAACSIHARIKKHIPGLVSNHEGKNFLEDFDVDTRMILKRNTREEYEVYWIHLVKRKKC